MAEKECMISKISAEEVPNTYSAGYGASRGKVEDLLNGKVYCSSVFRLDSFCNIILCIECKWYVILFI